MIETLIDLANNLDSKGFHKEADNVDSLIKESISTPQRIQQYQSQRQVPSKSGMHMLLDALGLVPGVGEFADLSNAILYLSGGITPGNLFNAGLSVVSLVPTLGDASKVIKYGSGIAPNVAKAIAQMIFRNQGRIKAAFDRFKNPQIAANLAKMPGGSLLTKYSDQMWSSVRDWMSRWLNYEVKQEVSEQ